MPYFYWSRGRMEKRSGLVWHHTLDYRSRDNLFRRTTHPSLDR
jgi:hypothetical protein